MQTHLVDFHETACVLTALNNHNIVFCISGAEVFFFCETKFSLIKLEQFNSYFFFNLVSRVMYYKVNCDETQSTLYVFLISSSFYCYRWRMKVL